MRFLLALLLGLSATAEAREGGQWAQVDSAIRDWFRTLMQPDYPSVSCCGEADAYYATTIVEDGKNIAVITDTRDDAPLNRPHVDIGTKIIIPNHKMKWDQGNPTGHAVIFLTNKMDVLCFVDDGGV